MGTGGSIQLSQGFRQGIQPAAAVPPPLAAGGGSPSSSQQWRRSCGIRHHWQEQLNPSNSHQCPSASESTDATERFAALPPEADAEQRHIYRFNEKEFAERFQDVKFLSALIQRTASKRDVKPELAGKIADTALAA